MGTNLSTNLLTEVPHLRVLRSEKRFLISQTDGAELNNHLEFRVKVRVRVLRSKKNFLISQTDCAELNNHLEFPCLLIQLSVQILQQWKHSEECFSFTLKCNKMVDGFEYYYFFFPIWVFQRYKAVKKSKNVRKSRNKQMKPRGLDNSHQIWALSLQVLKWHCNDKVELPLCKVVKWSWLSLFLVSDTFLSFPPLFPSPVSAHHSCFSFPWDPRTSTKIAKTTVCMAPADDCPMPGPGPPHSLTCQETCKFVATWC